MDIAPGGNVAIEIVRSPLKAAARKTLIRVCRKDPVVAKRERRWREKRPSLRTWRRGGRPWEHRMKTVSSIELKPGEKYSVAATVDVLRDLASVERWVKVTKG